MAGASVGAGSIRTALESPRPISLSAIWPAPLQVSVPDSAETNPIWDLMDQALAAMPAGSWTTYGDLAALIGSHPVPIGSRPANHQVPNAHRVLQVEGTVSPSFRWLDPDDTTNPVDLLKAEGVNFDSHERADQSQRMSTAELAGLAGLSTAEVPQPLSDPDDSEDPDGRDRFLTQLSEAQSPDVLHGVLALLDGWSDLGGYLTHGYGEETSCFMHAPEPDDAEWATWPIVIYPSSKFEVVFQHLAVRPPFDDLAVREELRTRLNEIPGVDLPASKISIRPGFLLQVAADDQRRSQLLATLKWFVDKKPGTRRRGWSLNRPPQWLRLGQSCRRDWRATLYRWPRCPVSHCIQSNLPYGARRTTRREFR